jgi:ADP-ribosyl-[dinitrogen reductase] hydrolase
VECITDAFKQELSAADLAAALVPGKSGVGGYMYHTVPVAVYAWARHWKDFGAAISSVIRCGGDTDTVAAIAGALVGAGVGEAGIPSEWTDGIMDWPNSPSRLRRIADALAELRSTGEKPSNMIGTGGLAVIPRNLLFLCIVLFHGFRRLLPPY